MRVYSTHIELTREEYRQIVQAIRKRKMAPGQLPIPVIPKYIVILADPYYVEQFPLAY